MATEILFSDLKAWLDAQPENTASTPYEIIIKNAPKGGPNTYTNVITRFVNIVGMEMGAGVTSIGDSSFINCTNLTGITIPYGVTSIISQAFQSCSNLTSVIFPASLIEIGFGAFSGCHGLSYVILPNGVTKIGESALRNCYSLNEVSLPGTVTSIGDYAFGSCTSLSFVYVYLPFSEALLSANSFFNTPSNLRLLAYPPVLSSWQSATLTNYGFASGVKAESFYTKWVRIA